MAKPKPRPMTRFPPPPDPCPECGWSNRCRDDCTLRPGGPLRAPRRVMGRRG